MAVSANAQKLYTGGSLDFSVYSPKGGGGSTTEFTILPEFGYNINNKWAAGVEVGYKKANGDDSFVFKPYARWTFAKSGMIDFFADGQLDLSIPNGGDAEFGIGIRPGMAINLSPKVALIARTNLFSVATGDGTRINFLGSTTALSLGCYFKF